MPKHRPPANDSPPAGIGMTPAVRKALERQRDAFREKFGRDPRPEDPLFFDPHCDHPEPHVSIADEVIEALQKAGLPPEQLYAFRQTGRLSHGNQEIDWPVHVVPSGMPLLRSSAPHRSRSPSSPTIWPCPSRAAAWLHSNNHPRVFWPDRVRPRDRDAGRAR